MPGLMARTTTIIKAKFSKVLDRAENPNETLDYSYEEQLRQLQNVKRGIADVDDREEAARDAVHDHAAAGREARRPGARGAARRTARISPARRSTRKAAVQAQLDGIMQQGQQLEAQQQKLVEGEKHAAGEDRGVPHAEGSDQGAVLGRRGAGADRRGGDRDRRADGRRRARGRSARRTRPSRCRRARARSTS